MDNSQSIEKRFIFNGNAVAFAAHIRRPEDFQFKAVASSCLPVTGGLAEASSGAQSFKDIISFESATTSAEGDYADTRRAVDFTTGNFGDNELSTHTFVDSRLTGLKITGMADPPPAGTGQPVTFIVKELHARLESFSDRHNPVAFRGLEAIIQGVSVDGHELIVTTAPEVCTHHETYDKLVKDYQEDGDFRKQFGGLFYPTGHEKTGIGAILSKASIPNAGGLILGTVVINMRWAAEPAPGVEIRGNRLHIPGIGYIFFGEILYEHNSRRLTLLRFQLGSQTGGEGSAAEVQSNGQSWPPPARGD
jgi:hypothetical protein